MEHTDAFYDSVRRYFNVIESTGSYPHEQVRGLVLYSFISGQILNGPLWEYLDEAGLGAFTSVLRCMRYNGCLPAGVISVNLQKPRQHNYGSRFRGGSLFIPRITEEETTRVTERRY